MKKIKIRNKKELESMLSLLRINKTPKETTSIWNKIRDNNDNMLIDVSSKYMILSTDYNIIKFKPNDMNLKSIANTICVKGENDWDEDSERLLIITNTTMRNYEKLLSEWESLHTNYNQTVIKTNDLLSTSNFVTGKRVPTKFDTNYFNLIYNLKNSHDVLDISVLTELYKDLELECITTATTFVKLQQKHKKAQQKHYAEKRKSQRHIKPKISILDLKNKINFIQVEKLPKSKSNKIPQIFGSITVTANFIIPKHIRTKLKLSVKNTNDDTTDMNITHIDHISFLLQLITTTINRNKTCKMFVNDKEVVNIDMREFNEQQRKRIVSHIKNYDDDIDMSEIHKLITFKTNDDFYIWEDIGGEKIKIDGKPKFNMKIHYENDKWFFKVHDELFKIINMKKLCDTGKLDRIFDSPIDLYVFLDKYIAPIDKDKFKTVIKVMLLT